MNEENSPFKTLFDENDAVNTIEAVINTKSEITTSVLFPESFARSPADTTLSILSQLQYVSAALKILFLLAPLFLSESKQHLISHLLIPHTSTTEIVICSPAFPKIHKRDFSSPQKGTLSSVNGDILLILRINDVLSVSLICTTCYVLLLL
jgi:hypothetical protein